MNYFSLTALLAAENRADLLRQAERYRRAHDAQAGSRRPLKQAKRLGWPPSAATPPDRSPFPRAFHSVPPRPGSVKACPLTRS
jgi:hypothetical protein